MAHVNPRTCLAYSVISSLLLLPWLANAAHAQSGQIRTQIQATATPTAETVSRDLLALYETTKTASSEADVTAIARACSAVVPDTRRSRMDRKYASSLLAWALNRRGEIRNEKAAKLVQQNQLDAAKKLDQLAAEDYATAIQYGPASWRTHHNYAIALAMGGDYTRAIEQFNESIDLNPEYANAFFNRGELYFELGKFEDAIGDYDAAIALATDDPQFFNSRGHCHFMLKRYDNALADYTTAASQSQDDPTYHTDLADAHQFLGNWQEAAEAYRAAVAIDSKYARAYQNAAWLMATCPDPKYRKTDLALTAAKRALTLEGHRNARILDTLAAAYAANGRYQEAAKLQSEAISLAEEPVRAELASRQQLYRGGQAYLQPQSPIGESESQPIRTASGAESPSR